MSSAYSLVFSSRLNHPIHFNKRHRENRPNPRSVTVFLDTCYSGTTRSTDIFIASRPIGIRVLEQSIPPSFTGMTAEAGDHTAQLLEETKHGIFS